MPTYDFKCSECGMTREVYKELGEDRLPTCCNTSMERVWSATPAIFRGGGWGGQ